MTRSTPRAIAKSQLLAVTAACFALIGGGAHAQEKTRLKFADWMPLTHYTVNNGAKPFMSKVEELSKGKVEFQYFPAEQLGKAKDLLTLLQSGAADIANISPAYMTDKLPLSGVVELPAMFTTSCEGTRAFEGMVTEGATLAEKEFKPNGVRVLAVMTYRPYKVLTSNRKIETIKDFSGLKLRTVGAALDLMTTTVGAVPIRIPSPDLLASMTRGTVDGYFAPLQSVRVFGLQDVSRFMTTDVSMGNFISVYAISDRAWARLPADLKDSLAQGGKMASQNHCEYIDTQEPKVIQDLEKAGIKSSVMAPGQLKALNDQLASVGQDWAATLDKRGKPGSAVLTEFRKAIGK